MSDLFGGDDRYADLLARLEALESIVYQTQKAERSKADEPLNEAWQKWNRYRAGKNWTAEAKKLSMKRLRELAGSNGELALKIVDQAIELGYTGLWPLRGSSSAGNGHVSEAPSAVQSQTVQQALAPTETKEERDAAHKAHLRRLGIREE